MKKILQSYAPCLDSQSVVMCCWNFDHALSSSAKASDMKMWSREKNHMQYRGCIH